MKIKYDPKVDAAYISFKKGPTQVTTVRVTEDVAIDLGRVSRALDRAEPGPGFAAMDGAQVYNVYGWSPGKVPVMERSENSWTLDPGTDFVLLLHMIAGAKSETVQPAIGLFFSDTPPTRTPISVKLEAHGIAIPAGEPNYVVEDSYVLPVDVEAVSIYPHAHYLGKEMQVTAALPGGAVKTLLHIPRWSFHWQQDYRYATPIALPAGTRLTMRYTFDNSTENPDNPARPPVRVRLGPKSTDEMADLGMSVLTKTADDAQRLAAVFDERHRRDYLALGEARVKEEPNNAEYRAFLGSQYLEASRVADAVPHLEAAIRLDDRMAAAHNDLGTALMEQGRLDQALTHFRRAVVLDPRNELMPFNLGNALSQASRPAEAAAAYQKALSLNADFPDAHVNLGALLFSSGRIKEALPHFQRAVDLQPNSAVLHNNLAGALAAAGRYVDAMQHVRRALAIKPDYAPAIDNFKRLQKMGIR